MSYESQPEESGLDKPLAHLRSVLIPSETLDALAIQRRAFALTHRRLLIAATSGRFIVITRHLLGGFDVANVRWQDLEEVTLNVGVLGRRSRDPRGQGDRSGLARRAGRAAGGALQGLRKEQAQAVYRICQTQDQAWREKRRVRELEELRARSGGIQVTSRRRSWGRRRPRVMRCGGLQEAKQLLDAKLITDAEYEAIKAKIVPPERLPLFTGNPQAFHRRAG